VFRLQVFCFLLSALTSLFPNSHPPSFAEPIRASDLGPRSAVASAKVDPTSVLRGLRVCFLAGTLGQGGAEQQLFYMASALKSAGAEVLVLSLTSGDVWESKLVDIGVSVQFVGASGSRFARLVATTKAVRDFHPSIVQSQHFYTNGYSALAAWLCGSRSVGGVRGNGFSDVRDCGRPFGKVCMYLPQRLAANSQAAIRNLVSLGYRSEKLFYLPNVVDTARFRPVTSDNGQPATVLGVGSLKAGKRFDRFLRVVASAQQLCNAGFQTFIAGDGPLRRELEQLALRSGLAPGTVKFYGNVTDIEALYAKARLLLLTSDHEGTPNVIMEAMSSGLPVVAARVGDVPDLVEHEKTGFVIDPANEQEAARHVAFLMNNACAGKAMGARARGIVQEHYAVNSLPRYLARLYSLGLT